MVNMYHTFLKNSSTVSMRLDLIIAISSSQTFRYPRYLRAEKGAASGAYHFSAICRIHNCGRSLLAPHVNSRKLYNSHFLYYIRKISAF
jgi:hypothetical protein